MESAVRYDFSFPPKSSSLKSANSNISTLNSLQAINSSSSMQQTHTVHNVRQHSAHHGHHSHTNNQHQHQQHHHQQQQHHHQESNHFTTNFGGSGIPKSASTSLLSCAGTINNNNNNNNISKSGTNSYCNSCMDFTKANCTQQPQQQLSMKPPPGLGGHVHSVASRFVENVPNAHHFHQMAAPSTPKDNNCSFTFDDLKNTLAFMEDSPLVNPNNANTSAYSSSIMASAPISSLAAPPSSGCINGGGDALGTGALMVIPSMMTNGDCGSSVSSLSSSSSSSSGSSSTSSSLSSCASCYPVVTSYLPKSISNPILANSSSSSSSSSSSTSPPPSISSAHSLSSCKINHACKPECSCSGSSNGQHSSGGYQPSILDLLMKKAAAAAANGPASTPSDSGEHLGYDTSSLVTTANGLGMSSNSLLASVHHQQQQQQGMTSAPINTAIETAAKKYRCAAQISEATCCWKGKLPPKQYKTPVVYSTKVFVGGLPWDITEEDIFKEFGVFGPCRVEWTNKEKFNLLNGNVQGGNGGEMSYDNGGYQKGFSGYRTNRSMTNLQNGGNKQGYGGQQQQQSQGGNSDNSSPKHRLSPGFAYVIYDSEYSVRSLVGNCIEDYQNGRDRVEYYFKISTRRVRNKEVQIIPWILADNNFALCAPKELDPKKTVFVGNLHGTMTARDLAYIMNELFGCVVYAGIDIDKLKYPIGSGRVTFSHQQNFMRAVRAAFVDIQAVKFAKRIQIDPYLEDVQCFACYADKGIYFCRDFQCFNYYCGMCWEKQHSFNNQLGNHKPLMRKREEKV